MWAKLEEGLDINQATGQGLGIELGLTSVWNRDLAIELGTKYERGLEGGSLYGHWIDLGDEERYEKYIKDDFIFQARLLLNCSSGNYNAEF